MSEQWKTNAKSVRKSVKDINNLDDINFNKMVRGQTPLNIEHKCLQLCKDYLSGNWSQQTTDSIEVRRITGGMVNQLYYCAIKDPDHNEKVPQEVAIKLYGIHVLKSFENSRLRDVLIALTFSEENLGPKIYGLFEAGQIQKYYQHRQFKVEEQKDPEIRDKVIKTLARIHSLNVPIKRDPTWLFFLIKETYTYALQRFDIKKEIDQYNCESIKRINLKDEIDWCIRVAKESDSPVLFTHNDYRSSNILITEPNNEVIICDFDVTGYGYRGLDFVGLSREWRRRQFDPKLATGIAFNDEEMKSLIEIYVEECVRIHGKSYSENPINSVDNILKELKIFYLALHLLEAMWKISNDEANGGFPFTRKVSMELAERDIKCYLKVKAELKEQHIID